MAESLSQAQITFIDLLLARQALRFGDFTLKSGRKSPYFINTGCFYQGGDLARLGAAYAHTIRAQFGADVDIIFGPAYKGIPLALATSQEYERLTGRATGWTFDRKEAKAHGDGGLFVGAPLATKTNIVIVDDVLTAGTAMRETFAKLAPLGVDILGAVVAVDRQEKGRGERTALEEIAAETGIRVTPIVTISAAIAHLEAHGRMPAADVERIRAHLSKAHV